MYTRIEYLAIKLFEDASFIEESDTKGLEFVEAIYFRLKLNWLELDNLLENVKYLPCKCTLPTVTDLRRHFQCCKKAWGKFYKCSEMLVYARNMAGQADPLENEEIILNATLLKNFERLPFGHVKQRERKPSVSRLCQEYSVH